MAYSQSPVFNFFANQEMNYTITLTSDPSLPEGEGENLSKNYTWPNNSNFLIFSYSGVNIFNILSLFGLSFFYFKAPASRRKPTLHIRLCGFRTHSPHGFAVYIVVIMSNGKGVNWLQNLDKAKADIGAAEARGHIAAAFG